MKTYLTPKVITLETASYSLKMQGTPQINCGPGNSPCSGEPVGASCVGAFSVGQIFLPGTDMSADPSCIIIVNGVEAGDCQTLFEAGPCEDGAEWVVECDATVGCQSDETDVIEVSCDGFQDATCELI